LRRLADEIGPAIPIFTFVLEVPSFTWSKVGSGGIFGEAFVLWGYGILRGIWPTQGLMVLFAANESELLFVMGWGWYL
jgi:hypothetical protein